MKTFIHCALIQPGAWTGERPPGQPYSTAHELDALLENDGLAIYSTTRKKVVTPEEVLETDGRLAEELFVITGIDDLVPYDSKGSGGWLRELICDLDTLEANAEAIWEAFTPLFERKHCFESAGDVGEWEVSTSQGYFDPYPEVDSVDFVRLEGGPRAKPMRRRSWFKQLLRLLGAPTRRLPLN